jgi:hypothetical protein
VTDEGDLEWPTAWLHRRDAGDADLIVVRNRHDLDAAMERVARCGQE